ncbi:unnamed protein product [Didymodactylos carnosus]|nr:unnamed protein product [Didymodactylos carnosus]CAF3730171.1 unnamed protein product [Didymodactylos carnosus]
MTLNGYAIVPSRKVKYLGLIIDEFLTVKPHIQQTAKNGTRYLAYLKNILRKNGILNANMMLQLYRTMIIPRTDLSACVWANVTKGALKPLLKLQKLTLATALGTSRQTVALSSLEVFCNLLPVYFRLMRRQMIKAITLHSRLLYHQDLLEKIDNTTMLLIYTDASKQYDEVTAVVQILFDTLARVVII